jgi:chromosome segregation ATPase
VQAMEAAMPALATADELAQLRSKEAEHKKAGESALKDVQEARAALDQLSFGAVAGASAGAGAATQPVLTEDAHLLEMQAQLQALTHRLAEAQATGSAAATQARAQLDVALKQFKQQVADLHAQAQDKPELKAYVAAAEQLQETTRALTTDLIQGQQDAQGQISELKRRLDEKIEAHREEVRLADKPLQALRQQLEMDKRLHNAGKAGEGNSEKMTALAAEIATLQKQVEQREAQLGKDAIYSDTISELQKFIDAGKKRLADTRKRTDQTLDTLQQTLAQAQSGLSKLPEEQKQLAAKLEQRVAEINAARKQYAAAVDSQSGTETAGENDQAGTETRRLQGQVAALQTKIDDYQRELAAANRKSLTGQQEQALQEAKEQKQAGLQAAQKAEDAARTAYMASWQQLRETELAVADAQKYRQDLARKKVDREAAQSAVTTLAQQRTDAQGQLDALSVPLPPGEVAAIQTQDPRQSYIAISVGGIAVVFTFLILLTFLGSTEADLVLPEVPIQPFAPLHGDGPGEDEAEQDVDHLAEGARHRPASDARKEAAAL